MRNKCIRYLFIAALALVIAATGCATSKTGEKTQRTEMRLTQCGFKTVPATTPQQMQQLQSLPPRKISVVTRNGTRYYVYPDADQKLLYVGRDDQYLAYQDLLSDLEEEAQYNEISKLDPGVAKYNNEAQILEGNQTS